MTIKIEGGFSLAHCNFGPAIKKWKQKGPSITIVLSRPPGPVRPIRATQNIHGYNITLTTFQVQEAIKQSKNNNSQGPDKLNIKHLKHIGPLGLEFLTSMFKTSLNKNIIPHAW